MVTTEATFPSRDPALQELFATSMNEDSCVVYIAQEKAKLMAEKSNFDHQSALQKIQNPNFWDRYSPVIIGGDLLTVGSLGLDGSTTLTQKSSDGLSNATMALGMGAGLINIGVGIYCIIQSIKAFRAGNKPQGRRYAIDAITLIFLGTIMFLLAIAPQVAALSPMNNWFNDKPWMLSTAFFIASIPTIVEVSRRIIRNNFTKSDLASQLKLPEEITEENKAAVRKRFEEALFSASLEAIREATDVEDKKAREALLAKIDPQQFSQKTLEDLSREERVLLCNYAMEAFQADMGVEAALPLFTLLDNLQKNAPPETALKAARSEIQGWNRIQKIRFAQQMIYVAAFIFSILLITMHLSTDLSAGEKFALMGANLIPLIIDITLPFRRNPHIVVDKVKTSSIPDIEMKEITT